MTEFRFDIVDELRMSETRKARCEVKTCEKCGGELEEYECSRTEERRHVPHRPSQCRDRLAARLAEAEGGPEGGDPPKGSRLWRCERELESARQHARDLVTQNVAQGKDRDALRAELAECRAELEAMERVAEERRDRAKAAEERAERYREALDWYAKSENYMHNFERVQGTGNDPSSILVRMYNHDGKSEAGWRPVVLDAGARARAALSETEKERP